MSKKKRAYLSMILYQNDATHYELLKQIAVEFGSLTVGIPSNYVMARLYGEGKNGYDAEATRAFLLDFKFIDDVLILDDHDFGYRAAYEKLKFDVCYYGSEYGSQFEKDKAFFSENGVDFLPLIPPRASAPEKGDSMSLALKNLQKDKKLILFGTGKYFDLFLDRYSSLHSIAYAIDSDSSRWNSQKRAVLIKSPDSLKSENPQDCLVVLCAKNFASMKETIFSFGEFNYRALLFVNPISVLEEMFLAIKAEDDYVQKSQKTLMVLLKEFDRVCAKHGLKYYVICGSLIGVVRHKGFIPWDDDLDVAMPRVDFEKLNKLASDELSNSDFFLLNHDALGGGAFLDFMPRLLYLRERFPTKVYDKVKGKADKNFTERAFLDIYPMDNAGKNKRKFYFNIFLMRVVYNLAMGHRAFLNYDDYARLSKFKVLVIKALNSIGRFLPQKLIAFWYDALSQYAKNEDCEDFFMPSCSIMCIERRFAKKYFGEGTRLPMNDMLAMVPKDFDGLLNSMGYYNYMNLPPLFIRKPSHYFNSDISIW